MRPRSSYSLWGELRGGTIRAIVVLFGYLLRDQSLDKGVSGALFFIGDRVVVLIVAGFRYLGNIPIVYVFGDRRWQTLSSLVNIMLGNRFG